MVEKTLTGQGFAMLDKAAGRYYAKLPDISLTELGLYAYLLSYEQNQDLGNGLQGYAYPTKERIRREGRVGKERLETAIDRLVEYGMVEEMSRANWRGGHPLKAYRPLPLLEVDQFLATYGHLLTVEQRGEIEKYKRTDGVPAVENYGF